MNMIKHGAIDCLILLAIAIPAGIGVGYLSDSGIGGGSGFLVFLIGAIYFGSIYRKKNGPMFFSPDGMAFKRLFKYSLGYGFVAGYPLAIINLTVGGGFHVAASALIALLAVPFFSMNIIGALALGRFLNRNLDE